MPDDLNWFKRVVKDSRERIACKALAKAIFDARKKNTMRLVIIESPFAGDVQLNLRYVRAAMRDCLNRNEAPYASHALYTQAGVLDDTIPQERAKGIAAGFVWRQVAECTVVYTDLGITPGMQFGINDAEYRDCLVEYRALPDYALFKVLGGE